MIDDKEPYNRIGRTIVKTLPENWEKVIFHSEVKDEGINWSMECFFEGREDGILTPDLMSQNPQLFVELEDLRSKPIFPKVQCDLIFRNDRTYELRVDRSSIEVKQPGIEEVQQAIQELRGMNLASTEIELVKEHLGAIVPGYILNSPIIPKGAILYRGVKWSWDYQ